MVSVAAQAPQVPSQKPFVVGHWPPRTAGVFFMAATNFFLLGLDKDYMSDDDLRWAGSTLISTDSISGHMRPFVPQCAAYFSLKIKIPNDSAAEIKYRIKIAEKKLKTRCLFSPRRESWPGESGSPYDLTITERSSCARDFMVTSDGITAQERAFKAWIDRIVALIGCDVYVHEMSSEKRLETEWSEEHWAFKALATLEIDHVIPWNKNWTLTDASNYLVEKKLRAIEMDRCAQDMFAAIMKISSNANGIILKDEDDDEPPF